MKHLNLFVPLMALTLLGAGCFGGSSKPTAPDGGVYKTSDAGTTWQAVNTLDRGTSISTINTVNTLSSAVDPQDPATIYVGTTENGLLYTHNGGQSWQQAAGLSTGRVSGVVVSTKDKCVVMAITGNRVFKTDNCLRDWNLVYTDTRSSITFTALAMDWYNPDTVYLGTSDGDILRSDNQGGSWRVSDRLAGQRINQIVIDGRDSRIVYAATNSGILKTINGGTTAWDRIVKQLQTFDGARRVTGIMLDPTAANTVYITSKYGVLRSDNGGETWVALKLPTQAGSVDIRALTMMTKPTKTLMYATDAALVTSADSGETWTTKKKPSSRSAAFLLPVMHANISSTVVYFGTIQLQK